MAKKCGNYAIPMRGTKKQDKNVLIPLFITKELDTCFKFDTSKPISVGGSDYKFIRFDRPADVFNCESNLCSNTGTLHVVGTVGPTDNVAAKFKVLGDAETVETGVMTFYVTFDLPGNYEVSTTISDYADEAQVNSDTYVKEYTTTQPNEVIPFVIRFDTLPTSVTGTGWTASNLGVVVKTEVNAATSSTRSIGFSSYSLYDSIEELEVNDTILLSCVDEFGNDYSYDTTDAGCLGGGYDKDSLTFEKTLTAHKYTSNFWKLDPLAKRGEKTSGYYPATALKDIKPTTIDGKQYGFIQVADISDVCGFTLLHVGGCNAADGLLKRVESPVITELGEEQYVQLSKDLSDANIGKFIVHASLIGKTATIYYPKVEENIIHIVANDVDMDSRKVKMVVPKELSDGTRELMVFNNAIVTGISGNGFSSTEEMTQEITITAERDSEQNFYEKYIIQ